jgi:hypothetical protein
LVGNSRHTRASAGAPDALLRAGAFAEALAPAVGAAGAAGAGGVCASADAAMLVAATIAVAVIRFMVL